VNSTPQQVDPRTGRLSDQAPFVWFAPIVRSRLTVVGWLFVALAVSLVVESAVTIARLQQTDALVLVSTVGYRLSTLLTVLLPVALLWRDPMALRHRRVLLGGLSLAATAPLVQVFVPAISDTAFWLRIAGALLTGYGLLLLTRRSATQWIVFVVVAGAFVAYAIWIRVGTVALVEDQLSFIGFAVAAALATGFALSVPVAAWLDRADPRRFWTLLALALPLQLAMRLVDVAIVNSAGPDDPSFVVLVPVEAVLALTQVVAELVAYVLFAPRSSPEPEPGGSSSTQTSPATTSVAGSSATPS
jgi:hypothetical protein